MAAVETVTHVNVIVSARMLRSQSRQFSDKRRKFEYPRQSNVRSSVGAAIHCAKYPRHKTRPNNAGCSKDAIPNTTKITAMTAPAANAWRTFRVRVET